MTWNKKLLAVRLPPLLTAPIVALLLASCSQVKVPKPQTNLQLAPAPYFDGKTGIYFPGALDTLFRQPIVDLEERSPGLGFAISYRNSHAKFDVFVYDLQASVIPTGIESDVVRNSFEDAIADLEKATDRRIYSNFSLISRGPTEIAGIPFLHARFSYGEDRLQKDGQLLVSGINGQIIKIRSAVTRPSEIDEWRLFGYVAQSMRQSFRNGYGGLSLAQYRAIEAQLALIDTRNGVQPEEAIAIAQIELVRQKRHNRFDAASAEIVTSSDPTATRVRFSPYPTEPAVPMRSHLFVDVAEDGHTTLEESPLQ